MGGSRRGIVLVFGIESRAPLPSSSTFVFATGSIPAVSFTGFPMAGFRANSLGPLLQSKAVVLHIYRSQRALRSVRIRLVLRELAETAQSPNICQSGVICFTESPGQSELPRHRSVTGSVPGCSNSQR